MTTQKWVKHGLIFEPDSSLDWQHSHAQLPTVDYIEGNNTCRVYFASRTAEQRSHIGWFDFDLDALAVIRTSKSPVLAPGPIGYFDQHGVYPSCIINHDGKKYLYYIGWNQGVKAPLFYAAIGLAISDDNGKTFKRFSPAPIMQREHYDPCLVTSPYVYQDNNAWRMTYVSGIGWFEKDNNYHSTYHIKSATSDNGIDWNRNGNVAIDFIYPNENNIARACVKKQDDFYQSWYCYVAPPSKYAIGYATSSDGEKWQRHDDLLKFSSQTNETNFDSEMMCYPDVINYQGKKYMFYNGNSYGKNGVGLAIMEQDD